MSGGIPIRLRRIATDAPVDPAFLGQPFFNTKDNKLGIYDGADILWYPGIDKINKKYLIPTGYGLSGIDSNGQSNISIRFNTPNAIDIVDNGNNVLVRFDETGTTFANYIQSAMSPGGNLNRMVHPGFLSNFITGVTVNTDSTYKWTAPNTIGWRKTGGAGAFTTSYATVPGAGNLTHPSTDTMTLNVNVASALTDAGIRMWAFDPFLGYVTDNTKNTNKFFISVYGPNGGTATLRIGKDGSYSTLAITGTGGWQRVGLQLPVSLQSASFINGGTNTPYSFDIMNMTTGNWYLHEPRIQCIDTVTSELFQYMSYSERVSQVNHLKMEYAGFSIFSQTVVPINFTMALPIYNDPYMTYDIVTVTSDYTPIYTSKSATGFSVNTANPAATGFWTFQPIVYMRGHINDIS